MVGVFLKWFGAASLLALAGQSTLLAISITRMHGEPDTKPASPDSLEFIFNRSGLNPNQTYSVFTSYVSPPHPLGDHLDHHCLRISDFDPDPYHVEDWIFGPESDAILNDARSLLANAANMEKCFSGEDNSVSPEVAAYISEVSLNGRRLEGAEIIYPSTDQPSPLRFPL